MSTMKNNKRGFTLIEIMLYIGIIAIIFSAIVPFAWNVIGNGAKSAIQQDVNDNVRFISERIKYEIRSASGITSVSANSISLTNFSPDTTTVIDLNEGNVRINKNGSGVTNLNSAGITVTDLTFTNNTSSDNKTKNISFTLSVMVNGVRQEYQSNISLQDSVEIRSN